LWFSGHETEIAMGFFWSPKEVTLNPDDFSIHILKRQKITLSEQIKVTYPGISRPAQPTAGMSAAGSSAVRGSAEYMQPRRRENLVVGTAALPSMAIKAAKDLTRKAVFCVSNLNSDKTCEMMTQFVASIGVHVILCFEAKTKFLQTMAFRICINKDDNELFLKSDHWPQHVLIRNWSITHSDPTKSTETTKSSQSSLHRSGSLLGSHTPFLSQPEVGISINGDPETCQGVDDVVIMQVDPPSSQAAGGGSVSTVTLHLPVHVYKQSSAALNKAK